jgi:hypothetical protein
LSGPAALRSARPLANNNRASTTTATTPSNIVAPKVVSSKTSGNVTATPLRQHNSQAISSRMLLASRTTPSVSHQRLASATTTATSPSTSTNLLKSVKPGLPVVAAQPPATCSIQGSRIPRPNSSSSLISSGGQPPKSSPSAASARLVTHATSSSPGLSAAHRHPSSPSLLLQGNNRTTTATTAGVKSSSSLHKSTSRLHLTHKGESSLIRSDLVSAH